MEMKCSCYLRKFYYANTALLLLAISLLSSCQAGPSKAQASPAPSLDRSSYDVEKMRETKDPADYDVLRVAKDLRYDAETGTLHMYAWRIESFDFLSEFENIKTLIIDECYIPEGVTIPRTDALNNVIEIEMHGIYGSGAADVLSDCLPLPKLDRLSLSGGVKNKFPLPKIPSLTDLYVSMPDALNVISNNTHITGALCFGVPGRDTVYENIESIAGVEKFTSIQYLTLPHTVRDISPVAGCASLRFLDATSSENIDSLKPLYGLEHLEEIDIRPEAYNALPEDEREHFSPKNNGDADAVHVYMVPGPGINYAENEQLTLSEQKIDSFDFLSKYPNLKFLEIVNCNIADDLVLPKIDTLIDLRVYDPNALNLIKNNTQLSGRLVIGTWVALNSEDNGKAPDPFPSLAGLGDFKSLEELSVMAPVTDISALSGCKNLRSLSLSYCTSIDTLKPLYGLDRLRMLVIPPTAFFALPQEDQERFVDKHKPYMTDLEWR